MKNRKNILEIFMVLRYLGIRLGLLHQWVLLFGQFIRVVEKWYQKLEFSLDFEIKNFLCQYYTFLKYRIGKLLVFELNKIQKRIFLYLNTNNVIHEFLGFIKFATSKRF